MDMITKKEAAQLLTVSPHTLDAMLAKGLIPFYRVGPRMIRLDRADVDRYLKSVRVEQRNAPKRRKTAPRHECLYVPGMKVV